MPLVRMGLYCQNVEVYFAPTADGRDAWLGLMRTVACEGRCFVVSANQCVRRRDLPGWITGVEGVGAASQGGEGDGKEKGEKRRKSIRRTTEEGHEIILPNPASKENAKLDQPKLESTTNGSSFSLPSFDFTKEDAGTKQKGEDSKPADGKTTKSSTATDYDSGDEFVSRGGSCIVGPTGDVLAGPLWEVDEGGLLISTIDLEDCERGRLEMDVAGSYGRLDSFELKIRGLDLNPPP